jgi:hypothetical protein
MDRRKFCVASDPTKWFGLSIDPWPTVLRWRLLSSWNV